MDQVIQELPEQKLPEPVGNTQYALTVAKALDQNFTDDDIKAVLAKKGLQEQDIAATIANGYKARTALQKGFTEDEILSVLGVKAAAVDEAKAKQLSTWNPPAYPEAQKAMEAAKAAYADGVSLTNVGPKPAEGPANLMEAYRATPEAIKARRETAYSKLVQPNEAMTARDLVSSLQVLEPARVFATERAMGWLGNKDKQAKVENAVNASVAKIKQLAAKHNIELEFQDGKYFAKTPEGQWKEVTPGFWDEMVAATGEVSGGLAGAAAGFALAPPHPYAKLAGGAIGGIVGAAAGSQFDYLQQAMRLSEDMNAKVALHKALSAAEMGVIGEVVGYPLAKGAGLAVKGGASLVNGMNTVRQNLANGNTDGALTALKDTLFVTDQEAEELVKRLGEVTAVPGSTAKEQAIAATALTKPGAEALVQTAVSKSPKASQALVQSVDKRAQDLMATAAEFKGEDVGKLLREDLGNYVKDVKKFYGDTKAQTALARPMTFNYDKLAVEPLLETLESRIQDPTVLTQFLNKAKAIRDTSDSRQFGDLLELRQNVNDFLFNRSIASAKDKEAIRAVVTNIDSAIEEAAEKVMPNADKWLDDFAVAKAKYAQMMRTQENVLVKALQNPKITEADIGNQLVKHMQTLDGTFETVMSKLPANARKRAEAAVQDTLIQKYTAGTAGGLRATNFPRLAEELDKIVFTTPESRKLKLAIGRLAETFTNDVQLARATGKLNFARPSGFMADDVVSKFKYQAAQSLFQEAQRYLPTERGRGLALIAKTAELLENPMHVKTVKEIMADVADTANIPETLRQLQVAEARAVAAGKDAGAAKVKLYGDGTELKTTGPGKEQSIPIHRIATSDVLRDIADSEGIALSNTKALYNRLKQRGYKAVATGSDRVKVL